ncbi:MAG TPA: hypothetical protein DDW87_11015 [Firmicutes bacterium]|nr:hypothetical protein [Bacillota bacterium]
MDGQVAPFEKIRGRAKALKRIRELVEEFKAKFPDKKIRAALSHAENPGEAAQMAEALSLILPLDGDVLLGEIGSTIGVHTGPGVVALFLYAV